jgi:hypothetical protein
LDDPYLTDVLWPAESIYEGTWSSGPPPEELIDFEVMREMGWSWQELQATPMHVRRYTWDLIVIRRQAETAANERSARG